MKKESIEMLNDFELLYNNITNNQAPGLNIYEISRFLTLAQEEKVKNAFNPKGNKYQEGYDDSIKRHSDFSTLIFNEHLSENSDSDLSSPYKRLDRRSRLFSIPENAFLILNEQIVEYIDVQPTDDNPYTEYGDFYTVIPLSYDEYSRVMQKPYKYPPKSQVWKLITSSKTTTADDVDTINPIVEIIGNFHDGYTLQYTIRYVKKPSPIILDDLDTLDSSLSIEGETEETICKLPKHLHSEIVERAVELAKLAWLGDINASIQAEERSE